MGRTRIQDIGRTEKEKEVGITTNGEREATAELNNHTSREKAKREGEMQQGKVIPHTSRLCHGRGPSPLF